MQDINDATSPPRPARTGNERRMTVIPAGQGLSREQFVANLTESGVLGPDVQQALDLLARDPRATDGGAAVRCLVDAGRLTLFQGIAVVEKRYSDLRIGNYDVLDRIGAGGMGT